LQRESLAIKREIGDRQGEAASLNNLGIITQTRGDLAEAERLYREGLAIMREIGDRKGEADSLGNLGTIAYTRGDLAEAERLHRESLAIKREIDIPIDQWFIDNGY
jgi:Flp pilus assembly protein TadD